MSVKVVPYDPKYKKDFIEITHNWVEKLFKLEESDLKHIKDVEESIIRPGGMVFFAIDESSGEVLGCGGVSLRSTSNGERVYELVKMGVKENTQGRGIGKKLGLACLAYAKSKGATSVYLETNSSLIPATTLYKRLGFQQLEPQKSPYARADLFMKLDLTNTPLPSKY